MSHRSIDFADWCFKQHLYKQNTIKIRFIHMAHSSYNCKIVLKDMITSYVKSHAILVYLYIVPWLINFDVPTSASWRQLFCVTIVSSHSFHPEWSRPQSEANQRCHYMFYMDRWDDLHDLSHYCWSIDQLIIAIIIT